MNNNNLILNAIHEYLLEKGYVSCLYFSARLGNPPLICAAPCISVLRKHYLKDVYVFETNDIIGIQMCNGDIIKAFTIDSNRRPVLTVEVSNPNLFDILEAIIDYPTREDSQMGEDPFSRL